MSMRKFAATAMLTGAATGLAAIPAHAETPARPSEPAAQQAIPIASPEENNLAMETWSNRVGVATTAGALTGTGVGFAIGCVIGGVVTSPTVVFVPLGCLTAGVTGAAIGGVVGTLVAGGPTAVIAGAEMVQVLLAPAAPSAK